MLSYFPDTVLKAQAVRGRTGNPCLDFTPPQS